MNDPARRLGAVAYRVLRDLALRVSCHAAEQDPLRLGDAEIASLLEPHDRAILEAAEVLEDLLAESRRQGVESQVQAFHRTAVREYDGHDMLDEALEFANEKPEEKQ